MTSRDNTKMAKVTKVECAVCGSRLDLHRHHVVSRGVTQCDDAENLVVLCAQDHARVHRYEIDLGIYLTPAQAAKSVLLLKTVYAAYLHLYPSESPKVAA